MDTNIIRRLNSRRTVTLNIIPPDRVALETGVEIVREQIIAALRANGEIPAGVSVDISGASDQLDATKAALAANYPVALIIVYLLLVAIFKNWGYPLLIMTTIPLGIAGGIVGLALLNFVGATLAWMGLGGLHQPFDMISMLGFLILMGTVVNNPILIVDRAIQRLQETQCSPIEAVRDAVASRLRPIATGDPYQTPPPLGGDPPDQATSQTRWQQQLTLLPLSLEQALRGAYQGISPALARQLVPADWLQQPAGELELEVPPRPLPARRRRGGQRPENRRQEGQRDHTKHRVHQHGAEQAGSTCRPSWSRSILALSTIALSEASPAQPLLERTACSAKQCCEQVAVFHPPHGYIQGGREQRPHRDHPERYQRGEDDTITEREQAGRHQTAVPGRADEHRGQNQDKLIVRTPRARQVDHADHGDDRDPEPVIVHAGAANNAAEPADLEQNEILQHQ